MRMTSEAARSAQSEGSASVERRNGVWPLLVRVHFYVGVFVAPFLVVAALTGLAYTLTPQLESCTAMSSRQERQSIRCWLPRARQLFRWPNQLVLAALVIGLLVAIFFGYRMWWQRRRDGARALVGRPTSARCVA